MKDDRREILKSNLYKRSIHCLSWTTGWQTSENEFQKRKTSWSKTTVWLSKTPRQPSKDIRTTLTEKTLLSLLNKTNCILRLNFILYSDYTEPESLFYIPASQLKTIL